MSVRLASLFAGAVAVASVLFVAAPADARRIDEARAKVEALIDELEIDRARIGTVFVTADDEGGESPGSLNYTGWISFTDCTGNLAVHLSAVAAVRTMYTTGDCTVPGVD